MLQPNSDADAPDVIQWGSRATAGRKWQVRTYKIRTLLACPGENFLPSYSTGSKAVPAVYTECARSLHQQYKHNLRHQPYL